MPLILLRIVTGFVKLCQGMLLLASFSLAAAICLAAILYPLVLVFELDHEIIGSIWLVGYVLVWSFWVGD